MNLGATLNYEKYVQSSLNQDSTDNQDLTEK